MASLDIALQHIPDSKPPTVEDGIRDGFEDNQATQSDDGPIHEFSLPRADGGKQAWLFLAGCFFIEALVWGELFSLAKSIAVHLALPMAPRTFDDLCHRRAPRPIYCFASNSSCC
jgi:hypothetical protein